MGSQLVLTDAGIISGDGALSAESAKITLPMAGSSDGTRYKIVSINASFSTSAAVGNRIPEILIYTPGVGTWKRIIANSVVPASKIVYVCTVEGTPQADVAFANGFYTFTQFQPLFVAPGAQIYLTDNAGIDPTIDSVTITATYELWTPADPPSVSINGIVQAHQT